MGRLPNVIRTSDYARAAWEANELAQVGSNLCGEVTVVEQGANEDEVNFHLLRYSTNLDGPTENFADIDDQIVTKVNETASLFFSDPAPLNHVSTDLWKFSQYRGNERKKGKNQKTFGQDQRHAAKWLDCILHFLLECTRL